MGEGREGDDGDDASRPQRGFDSSVVPVGMVPAKSCVAKSGVRLSLPLCQTTEALGSEITYNMVFRGC